MKVQLVPNRAYHVTFTNVSETVSHGKRAIPVDLLQTLLSYGVLEKHIVTQSRKKTDTRPPRIRIVIKFHPRFKDFLRLRPLKAVSSITTTCRIYDITDPNMPISVGKAFYSKAETPTKKQLAAGAKPGKPFDNILAQRKSLCRALAGDTWSLDDRTTIRAAFEERVEKQQTVVQSTVQAGPAVSSSTSEGATQPATAQP